MKGTQIGKERIKLPLFVGDIIAHKKITNVYKKKTKINSRTDK